MDLFSRGDLLERKGGLGSVSSNTASSQGAIPCQRCMSRGVRQTGLPTETERRLLDTSDRLGSASSKCCPRDHGQLMKPEAPEGTKSFTSTPLGKKHGLKDSSPAKTRGLALSSEGTCS